MTLLAAKDVGPLSSVTSGCSCSPWPQMLASQSASSPTFSSIQPQAFCGSRSTIGLSCSRPCECWLSSMWEALMLSSLNIKLQQHPLHSLSQVLFSDLLNSQCVKGLYSSPSYLQFMRLVQPDTEWQFSIFLTAAPMVSWEPLDRLQICSRFPLLQLQKFNDILVRAWKHCLSLQERPHLIRSDWQAILFWEYCEPCWPDFILACDAATLYQCWYFCV